MKLKWKKGDTVIYPQHGACIVMNIKRMKAFGKTSDYLILRTVINEMTLSIPVEQISTVGVRPPVSSSELQDLVSVRVHFGVCFAAFRDTFRAVAGLGAALWI